MSGLSPEALAQLEGLNLQEARDGLAFVPTVWSREPLIADLSADEISGFRGWDLSWVRAGLDSLTFRSIHPELVAPPFSMPIANDDLPDWLQPAEEVASAPTPEESAAESEEEEVEKRTQKGLADWLKTVDWKNAAKEGALILGPAIFSGVLWEIVPQLHVAMERLDVVGILAGPLTEGASAATKLVDTLSGRRFPKVSRLANWLASKRSAAWLITQISASAGIGIVAAEGLDRWFQAHTAVQAVGGETQLPGGQRPGAGEVYGGASGGLPPVETVVPHLPQISVDAGEAQFQAAEAAARAAEAARIAALQQGQTVAELAAQMPKHTISEAIYQMIGNVPHRGEVTNVLFRAIGDKVNNLNQGAIKAAADALRPVFDNIDKVVTGSGATYTEGGRAAVEALRGFNSPEAQAMRAANMGDLEAASNLLNNVIGPVIK